MAFMEAPGGDGEFTVYVKYNAKAGRWYTKDDAPNAAEFEVVNMTAVFDIPNLKTGWFLFQAGSAPDKAINASLSAWGPKPSDAHKRGFQINLFSDKNLLGVREFASTAGSVIEAMNGLYVAYLAAHEAAQGKLPVVRCAGVLPVTGKHGVNYAPVLEIVAWVDRPAQLGEVTAKAVAGPVTPAPVAGPAAYAPPPVQAPVQAPAQVQVQAPPPVVAHAGVEF
jgi:hypothetical protein